MKFPRIENIQDVLPFIEHKKEFVVKHKDDYTVIDYVYQGDDTFDSMETMEARGIKFYPDGRIMCRPPAKFFNLGENKALEAEYFDNDYEIHEKLDGSLITPIIMQDGSVRLGTKAGVTDVSLRCEEETAMSAEFYDLCGHLLNDGHTPIFEYVSPNNRIVIRYDNTGLVLLAVRDTITGEYLDRDNLEILSSILEVPVSKIYRNISIQDIREWKDREGVVLVWSNGYRIKFKADEYVLKHRVKDSITNEKNLIQIVLDDGVDDLVGILDEEDWEYVREYERNFLEGVQETVDMLDCAAEHLLEHNMARKEVAQWAKSKFDKIYLPCFWQVYDGKCANKVVREYIGKNLSSQTKVDSVRELFTPTT